MIDSRHLPKKLTPEPSRSEAIILSRKLSFWPSFRRLHITLMNVLLIMNLLKLLSDKKIGFFVEIIHHLRF